MRAVLKYPLIAKDDIIRRQTIRGNANWIASVKGPLYLAHLIFAEPESDHPLISEISSKVSSSVIRILYYEGEDGERSADERRWAYTLELCTAVEKNLALLNIASYLTRCDLKRESLSNQCDQMDLLTAAVCIGNASLVRDTIGTVSDVNKGSPYFGKPLSVAAYRGNLEMIHLLVRHGGRVNDPAFPDEESTSIWTYGPWSPLQAASAQGHGHVVRCLLEPSCGVKKSGTGFVKAIRLAARYGHSLVLKLLLKASKKPWKFYPRQFQEDTLVDASYSGNEDVVSLLLDSGTRVRSHMGYLIMTAAALRGRDNIVRLFLARGIRVCYTHLNDVLYCAAERGFIRVAQTALDHGADINHPSLPLYGAIMSNLPHMVQFLLENGAVVSREVANWIYSSLAPSIPLSALRKLQEHGFAGDIICTPHEPAIALLTNEEIIIVHYRASLATFEEV